MYRFFRCCLLYKMKCQGKRNSYILCSMKNMLKERLTADLGLLLNLLSTPSYHKAIELGFTEGDFNMRQGNKRVEDISLAFCVSQGVDGRNLGCLVVISQVNLRSTML